MKVVEYVVRGAWDRYARPQAPQVSEYRARLRRLIEEDVQEPQAKEHEDRSLEALADRNQYLEALLGGYATNAALLWAAFFGFAALTFVLTGTELVNHFVTVFGFAGALAFAAFGRAIQRQGRRGSV